MFLEKLLYVRTSNRGIEEGFIVNEEEEQEKKLVGEVR